MASQSPQHLSVNQYIKSLCHRIARLEEGPFKPLGDERDSEEAVNKLLIAGFTVPILASILQTGLAYLYFWSGHAWSNVLRRYAGTTSSEEQRAGGNGRPLQSGQSTPAPPQPHPSHLPEEGNPSKQEESKSGSDDGSPEEKDNSEGGHQTSSEGQSSQSVPKGAIFRGRWHYKQESKQ